MALDSYPSAEGRLYGRVLTLEITRYRGRGDRVHEAVNGQDYNVSFWFGRREQASTSSAV